MSHNELREQDMQIMSDWLRPVILIACSTCSFAGILFFHGVDYSDLLTVVHAGIMQNSSVVMSIYKNGRYRVLQVRDVSMRST